MEATIYYNPRCGTCQKVLAALEGKGYKVRKVEYLKTPPSADELDDMCRRLQMEPADVARQKEPIYPAIAAKTQGRAAWLKALHDNPILIERPIVVMGERAVIARPPEKLTEFLTLAGKI